jgi:hypothetical protein
VRSCSAWCRQDEGVHVIVNWSREPIARVPMPLPRGPVNVKGTPGCLAAGTKVQILDEHDAFECGEQPPDDLYPNPILCTVRVLS